MHHLFYDVGMFFLTPLGLGVSVGMAIFIIVAHTGLSGRPGRAITMLIFVSYVWLILTFVAGALLFF